MTKLVVHVQFWDGDCVVRKVHKESKRYYFIVKADIIIGKYEIDEEESNEDELVIYFE